MSDKVSAIRIKVEGYLTYVPNLPVGGIDDINELLKVDIENANEEPYDLLDAMDQEESGKLTFSGEIVEVEVDENGKIVPEAKE